MSLPLIYLLIVLSELLGTVAGFGSTVYLVPIGALFLNFHAVLLFVASLRVISNGFKLLFFYKHIDKNILVLMSVPSIIFAAIGAYFSKFLQTTHFDIVLGVFLTLLSLYLLLVRTRSLTPSLFNLFIGGSSSGLIAGLLGTGSALRGLLFTSLGLEKSEFVATSAATELMISIVLVAIYASEGYLDTHYIYYLLPVMASSFAGVFIGRKLLEIIPQNVFRALVLSIIMGVGILLIVKHIIN